MNEILFIAHIFFVSFIVVVATHFGQAALTACITLLCVLCNLFVLKEISLFGWTATPTDALTVGVVLGLNMMQEFYGKKATKQTIWVSFGLGGFYTTLTLFQLYYAPSQADCSHELFRTLLTPMPRIMAASITSYLLSQYVDYSVFGYLKKLTLNNYFALRLYGAAVISQLVDTVCFTVLGLYGVLDNLLSIILVSYTIKLMCTFFGGFFVALAQNLVRKNTLSTQKGL